MIISISAILMLKRIDKTDYLHKPRTTQEKNQTPIYQKVPKSSLTSEQMQQKILIREKSCFYLHS